MCLLLAVTFSGELKTVPSLSPHDHVRLAVAIEVTGDHWSIRAPGSFPFEHAEAVTVGLRAISPDGKWIAVDHSPRGTPEVAIYPFQGGEPRKTFHISSDNVRWTPDGRSLAYLDSKSVSNINSQPVDGSSPKRLTDFTSERIFSFAWSLDGKQLAVARGTLTYDVVLITDFMNQQ